MKTGTKKLHISSVLALLLLAVFALCLLLVLLTGAGVYQRTVERDQTGYEERTLRQYLASRVRQTDCVDAVMVSAFTYEAGEDTLSLAQSFDGDVYLTRIYVHDGYLRELFCAREDDFSPEDGEKVLAAEAIQFSFDEEKRLLKAQLTDASGKEEQILLYLRSGEGDAP